MSLWNNTYSLNQSANNRFQEANVASHNRLLVKGKKTLQLVIKTNKNNYSDIISRFNKTLFNYFVVHHGAYFCEPVYCSFVQTVLVTN